MWPPPVSVTTSRRVKKFLITPLRYWVWPIQSHFGCVILLSRTCVDNQKWASSLNHISGRTSRCFSRWVQNVCAKVSHLCFKNGVNDCNICSLYAYKPKSSLAMYCRIWYTKFLYYSIQTCLGWSFKNFSWGSDMHWRSSCTLPVVSNFRIRC